MWHSTDHHPPGRNKRSLHSTNELRADWLFSYRPVPGTLVYLGYGSTLEEQPRIPGSVLRRVSDGFFGKVSYVFRM